MKHETETAVLDAERMLRDLEELARISDGAGRGVSRVAFSGADVEARSRVRGLMEGLGMQTKVDPAGNTIGVYPGTHSGLPPMALGSHTDTVPNGGGYDGALGVVAALAVVRALSEEGERLRHPVEIINFSAEEATVGGGTFGSKAMAGLLDPGVLEQTAPDGRKVGEHVRGTGLDPASVTRAKRRPGDLAAYLELHVEQGGVLESSGARIGTVEGIVGIRRFQVTFEGEANHAGTTPMEGRRDALVSAAPFVTAVRDVAVSRGIIGTVGALRLEPNSPNVVPAEVVLAAEIRGLDEDDLDGAEEELARIAANYDAAAFERTSYKPPAVSDPALLGALEAACEELDLAFERMPSGAGHDAMCMGAITRQAMLLVPSRNGVSHSPEEYTDPESCVDGARVLLAILTRLDAELDATTGGDAPAEAREGLR